MNPWVETDKGKDTEFSKMRQEIEKYTEMESERTSDS